MSRSTGTKFLALRDFGFHRPAAFWPVHSLGICATWMVAMSITFVATARAAECLPDCPCPTPRLLEAQELPVDVDQVVLRRQFEALSEMSLEDVQYSSLGPIHVVRGDTGRMVPTDALNLKEGDSGAAFLRLLGDLLLATGEESLTVKRVNRLEGPYASSGSVLFLQSIRGLPVINGGVAVTYDGKTKRITSLTANFVPDRELPHAPKLSAKQAEQIAGGEILEPTYLGYYALCCGPRLPKLVWAIYSGSERVYVDAITGVVVARVNMVMS